MRWTDSPLGSALHDDEGRLLAKVRPLGAGGASAQWCNGLRWDVTDQLKLVRTPQSARLFKTLSAAKLAVEEALGVQRGVNAVLGAHAAEEFAHEVRLVERLAAAHREPAAGALQEADVGSDFLKHFGYRHLAATFDVPGVRIVTVLAAEHAALREQNETDAGSIDRGACFDTVDTTAHARGGR